MDPASQRSTVHVHAGLPSGAASQYEAHYGTIDSWYLGYKEKKLQSWTRTGNSLCLPSDLEKTEFYNDFLLVQDSDHECGLTLENRLGKLMVLTAVILARRGIRCQPRAIHPEDGSPSGGSRAYARGNA